MSKLVSKFLNNAAVGKLLSRSGIYALGDLMTKGARYITIPIFVACLTIDEIGVYSVLQAITMICMAVSALGFGAAVRRYYSDSAGRVDDRMVGRLWKLRLVVAAFPLAVIGCVCWLFSNSLFPAVPIGWVLLALLTGYLRAGTEAVESWYVIRQEPVKFRTFTFLKFLSTTALVLLLVVGFGYGVFGALVGEAISALAWCAIAGVIAMKPHRVPQDIDQPETPLRQVLRYSIPVIPHAVFMWVLVSFDRIILQQYVPKQELGVYEIGYLYAALMIVIATAINASWLPDFFRTGDHKDGPSKYARTADIYFSCVFAFGCALAVLAPEFIAIITLGREGYADSIDYARIVLLGIACQSLVIALAQPLFFTKRTITLALISGTGVLVNIVSNYLLVPSIGARGAAWSTVFAYGTMVIALWAVVHCTYRIPWNYWGLAGCVVLFSCVCLNPLFDTGIGLYGAMARLASVLAAGIAIVAWFRWTQRFNGRSLQITT